MELTKNPFLKSREYRRIILDNIRMKPSMQYGGKGFICALITSRCHIGCEHCMFGSNMAERRNAFNTMTPERVDRLMQLVAASNTGYLLVSGGGEGFLELGLMEQIAEKSSANLTWLVTSAFWAKGLDRARSILAQLYSAYVRGCASHPNRRLCIRVSVDSHHVNRLHNNKDAPFMYLQHLVHIFESVYASDNGFFLQLHSLKGDEALIESLRKELGAVKLPAISAVHENEKLTESALTLQMPSGYCFEVTFAKRLLSDMAADLRNKQLLADRVQIWEKDAFINEKGLAGIQLNADGTIGADMLVIYDGRVAGGWQCEMPDVPLNIDTDTYEDIIAKTFNDPGVLATIEKGLAYRFRIIDEVNPKASLRAKAVNIRDYTSPVLLEEDSVKLYYTVRAIQDFLLDGRLTAIDTSQWPRALVDLVANTKEELQILYASAQYDIVRQFEEVEQGFLEFSEALKKYVKNRNSEMLCQELRNAAENDMRRLDKWRLLLKRISHGWYTIYSWDESLLACADEVESLLDLSLLGLTRIYEGLSRFHPLRVQEVVK